MMDFILDQYTLLYDAYVADRGLIPPSNLVQVRFDELDGDPLGTMQRIYDAFGWADRFGAMRPAFEAYNATQRESFKKNQLEGLSGEAEAVVRERWAPSFKEFGYS